MATSKSSLIAGFSVIGTLASAVLAVELAGAIGGHTPNGFQYAAASGSFSRIYHTEVDSTNIDLKAALKIIKQFIDNHGDGKLKAYLKERTIGGRDACLFITYFPPTNKPTDPVVIQDCALMTSKDIQWGFIPDSIGSALKPLENWAAVQLFVDFYREYHDKIISTNVIEPNIEQPNSEKPDSEKQLTEEQAIGEPNIENSQGDIFL